MKIKLLVILAAAILAAAFAATADAATPALTVTRASAATVVLDDATQMITDVAASTARQETVAVADPVIVTAHAEGSGRAKDQAQVLRLGDLGADDQGQSGGAAQR
jgi:hypothetical protein